MKMKLQRRSKAARKADRIGDLSAPRPAKYPPLTARELRKEQRRFTGRGGYKSPWEETDADS